MARTKNLHTRTIKRKYKGGAKYDNTKYIIEALLDMKKILYLPKTNIIVNQRFQNYLSSVDAKSLLFLIKGTKYGNISAIQKLFGGNINNNIPKIDDQSDPLINNVNLIKPEIENINDNNYYNEFNKLNKELNEINIKLKNIKDDIATSNLLLENFKCIEGLDNIENGFITNFIMECSKNVNRDKEWFPIILHQEILDDNFEIEFTKHMNKFNIRYDYDYIDPLLKKLIDNNSLKDIFKRRIINCAYNPKNYINELTNSNIFDSFEDITNCYEDCILYLNDDYRSFLLDKSSDMPIFDKIKILIYCEHRIYQFSKYIKLEAMRINNRDYNRVKTIMKNLYTQYMDTEAINNAGKRNLLENKEKLNNLEKNKKQIENKLKTVKKPQNPPLKNQPAFGKNPAMKNQPAFGKNPAMKNQPAFGKNPAAQNQAFGKNPAAQNQPAFEENPAAQKGGNTTSENLMKQNILSQILQVLSEDDTTTIESIQDTTNLNPNNNKSSMIKNILGEKPMGQKPMGQNPMNEKPAFGQKPMGQKPMGQIPMGEKPAFGQKPMGQNPMGEIPAFGQKPMGQKPMGQKPMGQKPMGEKPLFGQKPMGEKPMNEKPLFGQKPMGQKPMGEKPVFGQNPMNEKPLFGQKPMGEKPMGEKPVFSQKPMGEKPLFGQKPMGQKPMGEIPAFGQKPMGQNPMDEKPVFGQKPMGEIPMNEKPVFGQKPMDEKPVFGQKPMGQKPMGEIPMNEKPMGDNLMDKSIFSKKPINNKEQFNPDKLLGNKKTDSDPLQKSINSDVDVYVPDCTAISNDILNNRIKQKNYLYLSPKCDKQIYNALINS